MFCEVKSCISIVLIFLYIVLLFFLHFMKHFLLQFVSLTRPTVSILALVVAKFIKHIKQIKSSCE